MRHEITINGLEDLNRAAEEFLKEIGEHKLIAFFAPMATGKTTFTTAICKCLGVDAEEISSPTFSIVNEYKTCSGESIYHFDFYRLEDNSEALDIGFYDYMDSGCLCIMEWPENIEEILPEETLKVNISTNPDLSRSVSWED